MRKMKLLPTRDCEAGYGPVPNNFRATILRPQRMVAECWLTDDPLLLDVG